MPAAVRDITYIGRHLTPPENAPQNAVHGLIVPDIPGIAAYGKTMEEAMSMARDLILRHNAYRIIAGSEIYPPAYRDGLGEDEIAASDILSESMYVLKLFQGRYKQEGEAVPVSITSQELSEMVEELRKKEAGTL
jgi:hypothetical protein